MFFLQTNKQTTYQQAPKTIYTLQELSKYDGSEDDSKPILLAINGKVYNMNQNKAMYGPGGTYHHFAGKDASRAFVTGCFKTGLTYDTRGFNDQQQKVNLLNILFFLKVSLSGLKLRKLTFESDLRL